MATNEGLVLDGLDLNNATTGWMAESIDLPTPEKRAEWVQGADADGALLVRDPLVNNRVITIKLRLATQSTMNAALLAIEDLSQKLEECEQNENGLELVWTPADSTIDPLTFYVLSGTFSGVPITVQGDDAGWFVKAPVVTIVLTCKPFGYADEVTPLVNLITNPSFEVDTSGWSNSGGTFTTFARGTLWAQSGSAALRVIGTIGGVCSVIGPTFAVTPGSTIDAMATLNVTTVPNGYGVRLVFRDAGSSIVSDTTGTLKTTTGIAQITHSVVVPATAATCEPRIAITGSGGAAFSFYVDAVAAGVGLGTTYFDGSSAGAVWTGTANASTSKFGAVTTSSLPLATLALPAVPGDVPAEGRLIVTDMASQARTHVEWGLEQRYYNAASPDNLLIDSDSMTLVMGVQTTRTGAYDPNASGNNVIRATLLTSASPACSTGNLGHVGTFRVRLRCYCTSTTIYVRLAWKDGDSPYTRNDYAQAVTAGWNDLDLGLIAISPALVGGQRWVGTIEAYSSTSGDTLDVDVLELVPAGEGYGKGRFVTDLASVVGFSAFDDFNQPFASLNGTSLALGGTWQGAGDPVDFFGTGTGSAARNEASDAATSTATGALETATGPTTLTSTNVQVVIGADPDLANPDFVWQGVVARYANISNYVVAFVGVTGGAGSLLAGGQSAVYVVKRVAGVDTTIAFSPAFWNTQYMQMSFTVLASGVFSVVLTDSNTGGSLATVTGSDSALGAGGALASGTVGLFDRSTSANIYFRVYDSFRVVAVTPDNVIASGRSVEFRHDGAVRADPTGTYYGPIQTYRGARFLVPPAGDAGRSARVAVKARRNDVETQPDDSIADSTLLEVRYRPRWLNVRGS